MDLIGPLNESLHENKYILTFLDDYSRFGWVFFILNKSDFFSIFYTWYIKVKNILNKTISYIQTDNGTEFSNIKFQSLLSDSQLSHQLWEYAADTANYIHNRIPHRGINNKIPFEIITNFKVDYSCFKVFGCRVFFYIPKSFRSKSDNNASPGIFLGYSENPKAYKILDIINNKIILSRTVEFFEDSAANSRITFSLPNIQLDFQLDFLPPSEIRGSVPLYNATSIPFINNTDREINQILTNKKRIENGSTDSSIRKQKTSMKKTAAKNNLREPNTYQEVFSLPNKDDWLKAIQNELKNMKDLNVFTIIYNIPHNSSLVSSMWVFKYKKDDCGNIIKRKARLVVRGFSQKYGIDYEETFSPTLKQDSLRLITAITVQKSFEIVQIDINSAYLNATQNGEIYMRAPEGHSSYRKGYWKLNKALYGLKQSRRE